LTNIDLYLITVLVSGVAVNPIKHDSASPDLPSQVSIVKYPNSVTTTGSYLRRLLSNTGLSLTASLNGLNGARGGSTFGQGGMNSSHVFFGYDANTQDYVLREGEGISFKTSLVSPQNYPIEFTLSFSDGTNTYVVNEILNINSATELFGMFNGAGSGVVLYVSRIEFRQIRTIDAVRQFNIETCQGIYGGNIVTPLSLDSANSDIDSLVEFKSNCAITQGGNDSLIGRNARAGGDLTPVRRLVQPTFGKGANLANGVLQLQPMMNNVFIRDKANNVGEIVLREGEGLAILQRINGAGWGNYEFNILFTVEDNGGTSEHSYVF
jgi:hypothetical protein